MPKRPALSKHNLSEGGPAQVGPTKQTLQTHNSKLPRDHKFPLLERVDAVSSSAWLAFANRNAEGRTCAHALT